MAVLRLEIQRREAVLSGQPFGAAGAYEKILGTVMFAIDPMHPRHAAITDLGLAPRGPDGRVEFSGDFYLLRPVDGARGNRRLLLDLPNRGRKVALGMLNSAVRVPDPAAPTDFGNGFLMRYGYTVAWIGWQHDVPRQDGLMALNVPAVRGPAGSVVGRIRCEFRPNARTVERPLADRYHLPHPTAALDDPEAELTVREHAGAAPVVVPREAWRFAREEAGRTVPDARHVVLQGGFLPGKIYDLVYRSPDPPVIGLAFPAVLDTAAFLRLGSASEGNPCAGSLERAYAFGVSQSGRFLRHMLYLGLNEDETGRPVFDAVIPHVAGARRGEFNLRLGQPSLNALESVGSLFPFGDDEQTDPLTGERDGLLRRIRERGTCPRIFTINTSAEYWRGDASLIHTDVEARRDLEPPAETRIYLFAGTQHTPGSLPPPEADPNTGDRGLKPFNVVDYAPLLRAALVNLDRWVTEGAEPPPNAVPSLAHGTAVPAESTVATFRRIPGFSFPDRIGRPTRLDFGPGLADGIPALPPKPGARYATVVSAVDVDGNEVAGIRPAELLVPLGTFTGWNPRHPRQGAPGDLMPMMGSSLPFPLTRADRERTGDPRPSIAERYASRAAYLESVRAELVSLVRARYLLAEDVDAVVERSGQLWDLFHAGLADPLDMA